MKKLIENISKKQLEEKTEINDKINSLAGIIETLVQNMPTKQNIISDSSQKILMTPIIENSGDDQLPIPKQWRVKIDEILGKDFEADVDDSSGGNYILKIFLPDKWDRRVGEKKGKDCSTGLIRRESDISDVKLWCERIRDNIKKTYNNFPL